MMKLISPTYPVKDVERAVEFYTKKLGFQVEFDNIPIFARVKRGNVIIGLGNEKEGWPSGCGDSYIQTDDVELLYKEYQEKEVLFKAKLEFQNEYGLKDFIVYDCDNNTIGIGGK